MTVKVWMPNATAAVLVRFNATTRAILRLLPRSTGSYLVRSEEHARQLTPYIVK